MKKLLPIVALLICTAMFPQNSKLLASCCDVPATKEAKSFGRCSGDAYCTACKNCSACKHCSKEGGSCGVCAPAAPAKAVRATKKKSVTAAKNPSRYRKMQMIEVTSTTLNLRKGPGSEHKIVEELSEGDMLTFISYDGEWIYVRVDASGNNGYVNYKFVK